MQEEFFQENGHSSDLYQTTNDRVVELMMMTFAESKHPIFRPMTPFSRGILKSKGEVQLSIHFCAEKETIETVFRRIISVNQLNMYEVVSTLCDEYKACPTKTWQPVLAVQPDPL